MEMKYDVFISYSSKDQKVVEGICGYLERYGLRCFVAYRDIPKGKVWAAAIADGIDDSAMMVVVFSQNFNRSEQVDREMELAAEDNKTILTYRISDDHFSGAKKYYLKNLNWIDAFPNPQEHFGTLYTNVCQLLGKTLNNQLQSAPEPQPEAQPKPLLWLWILLGSLIFGGVVFGVKSGIERKRERERIVAEQQKEQQRIAAEQQAAADNAFFRDCKDVTDYRSYLNRYPEGLNAELAKNKIDKHVADSTAKAQETERQRQIAAENERKAKESCKPSGTINGHEYVDLGLPSGTLWATCNVGASRPEDYGNYYAWGETATKSTYSWSAYKWCNGSCDNLTKYRISSSEGAVDNRTTLELTDNAARANWGGDWCMPTTEEWRELYDRCTWTWTTQCGRKGYHVTGSNGKSIFLPAAGLCDGTYLYEAGSRGLYWSSSLYSSDSSFAYDVSFNSGDVNPRDSSSRYYGFSVRPVRAAR
ncbi:MAG: TIR domain-containing protein [Bacteroidales bacterium]|nr:TIR domain-containing protein [Bacteroidales bacterium]